MSSAHTVLFHIPIVKIMLHIISFFAKTFSGREQEQQQEQQQQQQDGEPETETDFQRVPTSQLPGRHSHRSPPPPPQRPRPQTPPREEEDNEEDDGASNAADLHFAVGLPWYLLLHGREHARRPQVPPRPPRHGGFPD